jgi:drug/metabolite transporter (DMT)-like permease
MSTTYLIGLGWILVAGVTQGAFVLPMKYTRVWKWEHLWFWYSVIAFFILPLAVALVTVPNLGQVFANASARGFLMVALFGLGWGAGSIFFGLGVDAMMTGLYTALGALVPLVILTPDLVFRRTGLMVILGNLITAAGVVVCAVAGDRRDRILGNKATAGVIGPKRSFPVALTICILCGILSASLNFGYAFGADIMNVARSFGATRDNAVNAMWLVLIPAGGVLNVGYCLHLLHKNNSWSRLVSQATAIDWIGVWVMSVLWTGSVIIYGWGANYLGRLGPSLGWSLWNAILIATTFVCGLLTREWDGVRGRPLRLLFAGIGLLILGMFALGLGV